MKMQWNATGSVQRKASRPDQRWMRPIGGYGIRMTFFSFP
jgi:hypothetical protein